MSAVKTRSALVKALQPIFDQSFPSKVNFKATAINADLSVEAEMAVDDSVMNPQKIAHGGAIMTFMDTLPGLGCSAAALAANVMPAFSTSEMTVYFLDAAKAGTIVKGVGTVVRWGGKSVVWQLEAFNEDGTLIAKGMQTMRLKEFIDTAKLSGLPD